MAQRGVTDTSGCRADNDDESQPESIGIPEFRVTVTSVARNGESLERGRLHEESDAHDVHGHHDSEDEHRSTSATIFFTLVSICHEFNFIVLM